MRQTYGDRTVDKSLAAVRSLGDAPVDADRWFDMLCKRVDNGSTPEAAVRRIIAEPS
jgi:hypothetical protein